MAQVKITMSEAERQEFLAGLHIGVVSINEPERGPLTVPVWYDYAPGGDVSFITPAESRKAALLEEFRAARASATVVASVREVAHGIGEQQNG